MIVHGVSLVLPALVWPPWGPADGHLCRRGGRAARSAGGGKGSLAHRPLRGRRGPTPPGVGPLRPRMRPSCRSAPRRCIRTRRPTRPLPRMQLPAGERPSRVARQSHDPPTGPSSDHPPWAEPSTPRTCTEWCHAMQTTDDPEGTELNSPPHHPRRPFTPLGWQGRRPRCSNSPMQNAPRWVTVERRAE